MLRVKIARFLPFIIIVIFSSLLLINNITSRNWIRIPLNTTTDSINIMKSSVIEQYGNIKVHATVFKEIHIKNPPFLLKAFGPDEVYFLDGLHLFLITIVGIILCFTFWDFTYQRPFTKKTTFGIILITICLFVFVSIEILRNSWITDYLKNQTGHHFEMDNKNLFFSPEFWLSAIFFGIAKIFKNGTKLQQEHDLTV